MTMREKIVVICIPNNVDDRDFLLYASQPQNAAAAMAMTQTFALF